MVPEPTRDEQVSAVLLSGGLDSAVLVADESRQYHVQPVYVSVGLAWEPAELDVLDRLLSRPPFEGRVLPLARLAFTMRDVYAPTHWAIRGTPPAYDTPDEDVYLAGRNLVLLSKAGVFCAQRRIGRIALGLLAGNPFPDATGAFFDAMTRALSLGLDRPLTLAAPFADRHKSDVIRLGQALGVPMELSLSCMNPLRGGHCGLCSKCRERRDAFAEANVVDRTTYANASPR